MTWQTARRYWYRKISGSASTGTHTLTHSLTHSLTNSPTYLLTYSLIIYKLIIDSLNFYYPDILASSSSHPNDTIIGIDISKNRLNTCKSLLKQVEDYHLSTTGQPLQHPRHLIFEFDGQLYGKDISSLRGSLVYDSSVAQNELLHYGYHKKRNKSTRKREDIALRATEDAFIQGLVVDKWDEFDYVLCDVQCTHDYSYRHMLFHTTEREGESSNQGHKKVVTTDNDDELEVLQRNLLQNGFDMLKVGGSLVYSTCSELERQNEAVVRWLLQHNSNAALIPLVSHSLTPTQSLTHSYSLSHSLTPTHSLTHSLLGIS